MRDGLVEILACPASTMGQYVGKEDMGKDQYRAG